MSRLPFALQDLKAALDEAAAVNDARFELVLDQRTFYAVAKDLAHHAGIQIFGNAASPMTYSGLTIKNRDA